LRGFPQSVPLGAADRRQLAFDDEFAHPSLLSAMAVHNKPDYGLPVKRGMT
jgi:hypothetical protein